MGFGKLADGTALSSTQLNATASVPGTLSYSPALGTVLNAGKTNLTVTFTPDDLVDFTTATAIVQLMVNQAIPVVSWTAPAPITYGTPLSSTQLNATASVPGTFTYNPAIGLLPIKGTDILTATYTPADSVNYATVLSTVSLSVLPGKQGIEVPPPGMIGSIAGNGVPGYTGDGGQGPDAELNSPYGIAVDSAGNVYFADTNNHAIREVDAATGVITTVAGNGQAGYSGDGNLAVSAQLNNPYGIAVDATGNLYIADTGNNAVRKVDISTGNIITLAGDGTGKAGYAGDGGLATGAKLNTPSGVAVDAAGNVFIADWLNNAIREVNVSTGNISTVVGDGSGTAGYAGDGGPARAAKLNRPFGVAVDTSSNLYIADTFNNRVREVNVTSQIITTVAGNGIAGYSGDNGLATNATIASPLGVALDADGNLFIADWLNNAVREVIANNGVITTVAGTGLAGHSGDGDQAANATLNGPAAVATDLLTVTGSVNGMHMQARAMSLNGAGGTGGSSGNLYLADTGNNAGRGIGRPTINTPAYIVPPGMYLAWAFPTSSTATGSASATATSGSFYGSGSVTWSGFAYPSLPANSKILELHAVEAYSATSINGLTANMTSPSGSFKAVTTNGVGVASSGDLLTSPPTSIGATVTGSGNGSFSVTSAALAILYAPDPQAPPPPPPVPGTNQNKGVPSCVVIPYSSGLVTNCSDDNPPPYPPPQRTA